LIFGLFYDLSLMRFIYADSGLCGEMGHHANACRTIVGELRRRGIGPEILAFVTIDAALQKELGALPFFRCYTYWMDGDPICGWLISLHKAMEVMLEDFSRLGKFSSEDVIYVNSAQAAGVLGAALWLGTLKADQRPRVIMEMGTDAGVDCVKGVKGEKGLKGGDGWGISVRDTREDPRGVMNRFASTYVTDEIAERLKLVTFDSDSSAVYSLLMGREVGVLPLPQVAKGVVGRRGRSGEVTVSVLGHQRLNKGYQHWPKVVEILLKANSRIRILAHNSKPGEMGEAQKEMRRIAGENPRVVLDESAITEAGWNGLLRQTDLMVCPYDPSRFRAAYSAVAAEAIANGIPMVVPADTTLARMLNEFGGGGTAFVRFEPENIAQAILLALENYEECADRAVMGAEAWGKVNGPGKTVDAILAANGT
jgi:hypothetical protein